MQMLKNLRRAPLALAMPFQLFNGQVAGGGCNRIVQPLQVGIHAGLQPPSSRMNGEILFANLTCIMEGAMKKLLMTMLALALLAGCTSQKSSAPAEKPQPKPAEFETGRVAFQKMYVAAHGWARDAQPFRMQSRTTA